jgi:hypothetical protein
MSAAPTTRVSASEGATRTPKDGLAPLVLFAVAAVLNVLVAALAAGPGTADAAFYASAANAIAHGQFQVDFLWSFNEVGAVIPANPTLPVPIGGHWLPGAAVIAAPLVWLLGVGWPVPALGSALIGALAAPVAWRLALDLELERRLAIVAGLVVALGGTLLPFLGQPDNHGISAGLGALCLLLAGRAALGSGRALVAAAIAGGAMMLVRNDGLLYLLPLATAVWLGRRALTHRAIAGAMLAVAAIVGPWWAHQLVVFGTLSPSAAAGRSLWILNLDQFNRLGPLTFGDLLAQGAPAIIASRMSGLANALVIHALFFAVGGVLLPFAVYEAVARRRSRLLAPTLVFAAAFFAAAVLVFPAHIPNGMYIRSGAALLPVSIVLGLGGLQRLVEAFLSARRARLAVAGALGLVLLLQASLAAVVTAKTLTGWNERAAEWHWVAQQLDGLAQPGDRLAAYDAANAYWFTGRPAVNTPNESADILLAVARAYDLRWLVVLRGQTVPATQSVLDGSPPSWLGPPAARLVDSDGQLKAVIYPIR